MRSMPPSGRSWASLFPLLLLLLSAGCRQREEVWLETMQRDTRATQALLDSMEVAEGQANLLMKLVSDAPADLAENPALADISRRINEYGHKVAANRTILQGYATAYQGIQADYAAHKTDLATAEAVWTVQQPKVRDFTAQAGQWRPEWSALRLEYSRLVHQAVNQK